MGTRQRLRRYLDDELGECRDEDVDRRLTELESIDEAVGDRVAGDIGVAAALANETRYRIVRLIDAADSELCVCELTPLLDVSDSAISHALSELREAGLLTRRKDGKWRKYQTTRRATALLIALDGSRNDAVDG